MSSPPAGDDGPRADWPDVLPGALVITPRRAPYAIALVSVVLIMLGLAAVATSAGTTLRIVLMILASLVGLAGVSLLFRFLQAGKPQLVADAVGVKTTLTPRRVPWEQVERVRILPQRSGRSARIGIVPTSIEGALGARMNVDRLIKILEARQRRDGAPFVVSLATTKITPDVARARLTELTAGRAPVTD